MWQREFSQFYPNVSAQSVWQRWIDINNWPQWHDDLDYCKLLDKFEVGHYFMLKPKKAPAVKIQLTDINPGSDFTDCTTFFGAKMIDTHRVEAKAGGVQLSNKLVVTGPLTRLWVKLVANHVAETVGAETDALVRLIRQAEPSANQFITEEQQP